MILPAKFDYKKKTKSILRDQAFVYHNQSCNHFAIIYSLCIEVKMFIFILYVLMPKKYIIFLVSHSQLSYHRSLTFSNHYINWRRIFFILIRKLVKMKAHLILIPSTKKTIILLNEVSSVSSNAV